eukprot:TCONS_00040283-protein
MQGQLAIFAIKRPENETKRFLKWPIKHHLENFKSFVQYLLEEVPNIVDGAIGDSEDYLVQLVSELSLKTLPAELDCHDAAALMMGNCDLSQRSYKALKKALSLKNVTIPTYDKLREYCKTLNVGEIKMLHQEGSNEKLCDPKCMGYGCSVTDTIKLIFNSELWSKMNFLTFEQQSRLKSYLSDKNKELYGCFDPNKKTILLRDTGDNFRAAMRYPTEQTSFSLMNISE